MAEVDTGKHLSEERRKEIFASLVDAQDHNMTVVQSRKFISERFHISSEQLRQIEREGMQQQWPPL